MSYQRNEPLRREEDIQFYRARLLVRARFLMREEEAAHDIVGLTICAAVQAFRKQFIVLRPENWLYKIQSNVVADEWRRRGLQEKVMQTPQSFVNAVALGAPLLEPNSCDELLSLLMHLEPEDFGILMLKDYESRTWAEISDLSGVGIGVLRARHIRALERARSILLS